MHLSGRSLARCSLVALGALWCLGSAPDAVGQEAEEWRVSPEPELRIGVVDGEEAYLFQFVRFARFLPDGGIAVSDAGQVVIRIYGPDGNFRTEMGGRGSGPGRFQALDGMWLTPDGRIGAWDGDNRRISTFAPDGTLESTNRVRAEGRVAAGNLEVFLGAFGDGDVALASMRFGGDPREEGVIPERWAMGRFGPDGELRGRLGELRGMRRVRGSPVPFSPVPQVAVHRDTLYVSDGYEAEIAVIDGSGDRTRTIGVPRGPAPADDPRSSLEAALRSRGEDLKLRLLERMPPTERLPAVGGLLVDDRGLLWAKAYDPSADALRLKRNALQTGPGGTWQVLRPDGQLVATVEVPDRVIPLEIEGRRLLGVSRDAMDVERVVVHTVER